MLVKLFGGGELCATGEVVAVAVGEKWVKRWIETKYGLAIISKVTG